MADGWQDFFDETFEPEPRDYADILFGNARDTDPHALELFSDWMGAGMRADTDEYRDLVEYMWAEHDIDFEDVFEWQDFQEWYDSQ